MRRLLALVVIVLCAVPGTLPPPVASAATAPGIEGRITGDGASLTGATVQAIQSGAVVASDTTDGTGRYDLDLPAAGTYDVRVVPAPGAPFTGTVANGVAVGPSIVTVLDIQLRSPLGTLEVTVLDGTGDAVVGAQVSLRGAGFTVTTATTDGAGTARLVSKPGTYGLRIEAPSPLPAGSPIPAGTVIDTARDVVEVSVAGEALTARIPTTTLTVTTTRESDPTTVAGVPVRASVSGATVDLGGGLTGTARFATTAVATDAAGVVALGVIPAPGVRVSADPTSVDRFLSPAGTTTDVPAGGGTATVPLPATPVQPVTVRLLDTDGEPVSGARVSSELEVATTDADGFGTVLARSDRSSELRVAAFTSDPALPEAVTFQRQVSPSAPLALVAQVQVATLTATAVRADDGTPIPGARIGLGSPSVVVDGWTVRSQPSAKTANSAGQATFRVVPADRYNVWATAPDYLAGSVFVDVTAPTMSATVQLDVVPQPSSAPGVPVTGRVVTSGGVPIGALEVRSASTGSRLATTDAAGNFAFEAPLQATPQSIRLQSADLRTFPNGSDAPLPESLQVVIPDVFTASTPDPISLGDIVLPLDTLVVRVVDQAGGGIGAISIAAESRVNRFPVTVGGTTIEARGTADYPATFSRPIVLTEAPGEATLHLLPGIYEIELVRDYNFQGLTLPISAFAAVDPSTDDILQIALTRPNAALLTTLDGAPKVADGPPLELEGPRPRLIPVVALPDGFQDGTTSTRGQLLDWVLCDDDDGISETAVPTEDCPDDARLRIFFEWDEEECPELDCDRLPDFPTYPVDVRVAFRSSVRDGAGNFLSEGYRAFDVRVLPPVDRPPTLVVARDDERVSGPEGSIVTFRATATDDQDGPEVSWDLDGDGIGEVTGETLLFDLPDGPDEGALVAIATDSSGQSTSRLVYWSSSNVPPNGVLRVTGPDGAGTVDVTVVDITDPSADDLAAGITVALDLDDDGTFETAGATGSIDASGFADGTYGVRARLVDRDRGQRILTASFRVGAPPPNGAPTVDPGGPYAVGEGGTIQLDASADDPDGDPVTITWDVPGQGASLADPVTFDAAALDGPTTVDATVTACDTPQSGEQECDTEAVTVTVTNVAPSVSVGNVSGTAGTEVTLPLTISDPAPADVLRVIIDWGDGTTGEVIDPYVGAPVAHTYADDGTYTVAVEATDDDGGTTRAIATATIEAVPSPPPPPPTSSTVPTEPAPPTEPVPTTEPTPTSSTVPTEPAPPTEPALPTEPTSTVPAAPTQSVPTVPVTTLPSTGSSIGPPLVGALGLLALGFVLQASRRRPARRR